MLRIALALATLLVAAPASALAQGKAQSRAQLDSVTIHLFLATSGTWSPDIETIEGFGAWNFGLQGQGIADNERFYVAMIRVRFTSPREVYADGTQAQVVVTDRRTKRVVKRETIAGVLVGPSGASHVPVFLNAACGPFEVVVTGGGRKIVKQIEAACGE
jgi:hypothetical protein